MFKTELAREIWASKYRFGDETPLETFQRVARSLASVETDPDYWYPLFLETLVRFNLEKEPIGLKTTCGGRITANIGTTFSKATLINCFIAAPVSSAEIKYVRETKEGNLKYPVHYVTDSNPDDLINIFLTITEQAKTLASEGGYGLNFDFIRPRGSLIKGMGIRHPGVVAYMKVWDSVAQCIVQGDVDGYVDKIKNYLNDEIKFKEVTGIVKNTIRKGAMLASLSCFSEDTEIFTNMGWLMIIDLIFRVNLGENILAYDDQGNLHEIYDPIIKEPEEIFEIETEDGSIIEVTGDHQFEVRNIETQDIYLKALKDIDPNKEELKMFSFDSVNTPTPNCV